LIISSEAWQALLNEHKFIAFWGRFYGIINNSKLLIRHIPDPQKTKMDLPAYVVDIINKALEKSAYKHYQDGNFFAKDLNNCIVNIDD
jgi:hypothetical protein